MDSIPIIALAGVGPKILHQDDLLVLQVSGPNDKAEFHINGSPEVLYQVQGTAEIELLIDGRIVTIHVGEHELFVIPAKIPHRPIREAGTIGLVVERVDEGSCLENRYVEIDRDA